MRGERVGGGQVYGGGVGVLRGGLQSFNVCVNVVLLANAGVDEATPPEKILILTHSSHVTIFLHVF